MRKLGPEGSEMHRDGGRPPGQGLAPPLHQRLWMVEGRTEGILPTGPALQPSLLE